jgi:hypothetical protein
MDTYHLALLIRALALLALIGMYVAAYAYGARREWRRHSTADVLPSLNAGPLRATQRCSVPHPEMGNG